MKKVRFVGLDVHAQTIAAAAAESNGEVRNLGVVANRIDSVRVAEEVGDALGAAGVLRGGCDGVGTVLAIDRLGGEVRGDCPDIDADEAWGSSQDR